MKKLLPLLVLPPVIALAALQLIAPVQLAHAEACSTGDTSWCEFVCDENIPPNCVSTGSTCDMSGSSITCGCDMFCTYPGHEGGLPGGYRHLAFVEPSDGGV